MKKYFLCSLLIHLFAISALVFLLVELEYITFSSGSGSNLTAISVYKDSPSQKDTLSNAKGQAENENTALSEQNLQSANMESKNPENNVNHTPDSKKRYKIAENSSKISKVTQKKDLLEHISENKSENETESGGKEYSEGEKLTTNAVPEYGINPKPQYPLSARRRGYEGEVIFRVLVLDNGDVGELEILKTSGYDILDNSAHTTLQKWKFIPRRLNGRSVSSWVKVPILFRLNDA